MSEEFRAPPAGKSAYKNSLSNLQARLAEVRRITLKPLPIMSLSEWADEYAYLSRETSAEPGKFTAFEFQNGIMDAVTDPKVKKVTVMKSSRVGYTKILDHVVGYFIHQDPSPMIIVQPREWDAHDYNRTEIMPMLRDTPVLREIVGDLRAKDATQTKEKRVFPNGSSVAFVGANSGDPFRRVTARVVAFDEVDAFEEKGAGNDGDVIAVGSKRALTFWNSKILLGSSPLIEGRSRIETSFNESDQRRYYVPCPHCGHRQVLKWENLLWDKGPNGEHLTETAHFRCEAKGCRIEEDRKAWMVENGEWIAEAPFKDHAGFHVWTAYSLFPSANWQWIADQWLESYKSPVRRQPFFNTVLGLTYKDAIETTDPEHLRSRVEPYGIDTLPDDIKLVTYGADTQDDRLEVTFMGWGNDEESWVIAHDVLPGDTSDVRVWNDFDALIRRPFQTESGRRIMAKAGCIDAGGHRAEMVYKFCRDRKARRIYPIRGRGNSNETVPLQIWSKTPSRTKNSGDKPYTVGVDTAKDDLASRLAIIPNGDAPTPRAIHFPADDLPGDYFEQLTAEHALLEWVAGKQRRRWTTKTVGRRNEAWDCMVYALAARLSFPKTLKSARPADPDITDKKTVKPIVRTEPRAPVTPEPELVNDNQPARKLKTLAGRWRR